jgi:hypothetical protein
MEQNRSLPVHLRKIIEDVHNDEVQPVVTNYTVEKKKPGPKPKSFNNANA